MSITEEQELAQEIAQHDCAKYGHWQVHEGGPTTCRACGELIGSTVSKEPYDFAAARRELEAIHAFLRKKCGIEQSDGDGEWGAMSGGLSPEWDEWGSTVDVIRALVQGEGYGTWCQARMQVEARLGSELAEQAFATTPVEAHA